VTGEGYEPVTEAPAPGAPAPGAYAGGPVAQPGYDPNQPGYGQPQPGYNQAPPGYEQAAQPGYDPAAQPGYDPAAQAGYGQAPQPQPGVASLPDPGRAQAAPPLDPDAALASKAKGGRWRKLLLIFLSVAALIGIGAALYYYFGDRLTGDDDTATDTDFDAVGPGSFNEPHARDTGVSVFYPDDDGQQNWVIEVVEPVRDATAEITEAGGDAPPDGQVYAAARVRVLNESGPADTTSLDDLEFNAVNSDGDVIIRADNACPVVDGALDYGASVPVEDSTEGDVCLTIASGDLDGLVLGVGSTKVAGRVHIDLE
jgi:hypothetical protein